MGNKMIKIVFRTDASVQIGTGHVMRCLTLAKMLQDVNAKVSFICQELPGNLCDLIEEKGFTVYHLPTPIDGQQKDALQTLNILQKIQEIDWLIVDHYSLDHRWEKQIKPYVKKIMVIDDLANRYHQCDVLLDHSCYSDIEGRYKRLIPSYCQTLLGPQYALLRPEFTEMRKNLTVRKGQVERILISFGGSDSTNETMKAVKAIKQLKRQDIMVDVVVGKLYQYKKELEHLCSEFPSFFVSCQVANMAKYMANADLAIGAGGTTTWERCYLGLPSITIITAQNQFETTRALHQAGATWNMGVCQNVSVEKIKNKLRKMLKEPWILEQMSKNAFRIMTGITGGKDKHPIIQEIMRDA